MLCKIVATDAYENIIREYQSFYNTDEVVDRKVVVGSVGRS